MRCLAEPVAEVAELTPENVELLADYSCPAMTASRAARAAQCLCEALRHGVPLFARLGHAAAP